MVKPTKILLVEDGLVSERMAKFALQGLGNIEIDSIDCGKIALQLLHTRSYDLIFMDLGLPDIDGIEVARHIRQLEQEQNLTLTPIIALTAQAGARAASASLKAGMNGFIPKPLTPEKAQAAINRWLDN